MSEVLPTVYLVRQGETSCSLTGLHTGLTDLPLTGRGKLEARMLREPLTRRNCSKVFTSPLLRVTQTCKLAGFSSIAEVDPYLTEWDYGEYEGLRTTEIQAKRPGWQICRDGCPGGELPKLVGAK
jgi:probable phosphoglycerate mutase